MLSPDRIEVPGRAIVIRRKKAKNPGCQTIIRLGSDENIHVRPEVASSSRTERGDEKMVIVNPGSLPTPETVNTEATGTNSRLGETCEASVPAIESAIEVSSSSRTVDLKKLLETVRQIPEVRSDILADVSERLNSGELQTKAASIETAVTFHDQYCRSSTHSSTIWLAHWQATEVPSSF